MPDHPGDGHGRRRDAVRLARDGLDRGGRARRHGQAEPRAEHGQRERGLLHADVRASSPPSRAARDRRPEADQRHEPQPQQPHERSPMRAHRRRSHRRARPSASRCSSGPPYSTRSTNTAAADDRRREAVAGEPGDERRRRERGATGTAADRGTGPATREAADDRDDERRAPRPPTSAADEHGGVDAAGVSARAPSIVSEPRTPTRNSEKIAAPDDVHPARATRRLPAALAAHDTASTITPIGTLT